MVTGAGQPSSGGFDGLAVKQTCRGNEYDQPGRATGLDGVASDCVARQVAIIVGSVPVRSRVPQSAHCSQWKPTTAPNRIARCRWLCSDAIEAQHANRWPTRAQGQRGGHAPAYSQFAVGDGPAAVASTMVRLPSVGRAERTLAAVPADRRVSMTIRMSCKAATPGWSIAWVTLGLAAANWASLAAYARLRRGVSVADRRSTCGHPRKAGKGGNDGAVPDQ